jgi:hypothetical protein
VKTENPSASVTVNCKVCRSVMALELPVILSTVYKLPINPIQNPSYRSRTQLNPDNIFYVFTDAVANILEITLLKYHTKKYISYTYI